MTNIRWAVRIRYVKKPGRNPVIGAKLPWKQEVYKVLQVLENDQWIDVPEFRDRSNDERDPEEVERERGAAEVAARLDDLRKGNPEMYDKLVKAIKKNVKPE